MPAQGWDTPITPDELERTLLETYQHDFPLEPEPFARIAADLGVPEDVVLEAFRHLQGHGAISRIGAVVRPHAAGWSTLAALEVPPDRLEAVADLVNGYPQVNHNYEREHDLNLWFVVTGADADEVRGVLDDIAERTGLAALDLPLIEPFHIDLGFKLEWR